MLLWWLISALHAPKSQGSVALVYELNLVYSSFLCHNSISKLASITFVCNLMLLWWLIST